MEYTVPVRSPRKFYMTVFTKEVPDTHYVHLRDLFMTSLTVDEFHAVEFYTSSGFKEINQYMMKESHFSDAATASSYQNIITHISNAIDRNADASPLPKLFRGTKQKHVQSLSAGDVTQFPFFLSASTDPVVASRFAGSAEPAVIVINGIQSKYAATSLANSENEVILPHTSRFFVDSVTHGVDFQAEYDSSGFYAPEQKNVTVVEVTVL